MGIVRYSCRILNECLTLLSEFPRGNIEFFSISHTFVGFFIRSIGLSRPSVSDVGLVIISWYHDGLIAWWSSFYSISRNIIKTLIYRKEWFCILFFILWYFLGLFTDLFIICNFFLLKMVPLTDTYHSCPESLTLSYFLATIKKVFCRNLVKNQWTTWNTHYTLFFEQLGFLALSLRFWPNFLSKFSKLFHFHWYFFTR